MNLKLISVSGNKQEKISTVQIRIFEVALEVLPKTDGFDNYDNSKDFLLGLSQAFEHDDMILVAVDTDIYLEQKQLILRSLHLKGELNNKIVKAISNSTSDDDPSTKIITSHSVVPQGAEVFLTENGLYSGFAVRSGDQRLIFVPLDLNMIESILVNGLSDYLNLATDPDFLVKNPADNTVKPLDENSLAYKTLQALSNVDLRAAIAITQTAGLIKKRFSEVIELTKYIEFIPCEDEYDSDTPLKTHVAALAKTAMDEGKTDVGAAISKIYSSDDEGKNLFVLVTVANENYARLVKLCNENGETAKELANSAVDLLFKMLCDYTENKGIPPEDANILLSTGELNKEDLEIAKSKPKRIVFGIVITVIIALVLCFLTAYFFDDIKAFAGQHFGSNVNTNSTLEHDNIPVDNTTDSLRWASDTTITDNETTLNADTTNDETSTKVVTTKRAPLPVVEKHENAPPSFEIIVEPASDYVKVTTTKKPTSKVTTTKKTTTTNSTKATTTTVKPTTAPVISNGSFVFTTRGYGHGVGMSQEGAKAYSKSGWAYDKILLHYYPGTKIKTDSSIPNTIKFGANEIDTRKYLARVSRQEIGPPNSSTYESFKSQVVAVYTYAKYFNYSLSTSQHAYYSYEINNQLVYDAVDEVLGKYLDYNGRPALTTYSASCAGKTVSAEKTWGGTQYPYLCGGVQSIENVRVNTVVLTTDEVKSYIESFDGANIELSENPNEWFEVLSKDSTGYVEKIRVGNIVISGNAFRSNILKFKILSHCFVFEYKPD